MSTTNESTSDSTSTGFEIQTATHRHYVLGPGDDGRFECQIGGEDVPLLIGGEILNLADLGMELEPEEEYVFAVDWQIMVAPETVCSEYAHNATHGEESQNYSIIDGMIYSGGPTVSFYSEINPEEDVDVDHIVDDAGRCPSPLFRSREDIDEYVEEYVLDRASGVAGLIGFFLDKPVNRIGATGWNMIEKQLDYEKPGLMAPMRD
jgi:hypothetical protein